MATLSAELRYTKPHRLADAFDLLEQYGTGASLLAGGTDLVVGLRKNKIAPRALVDLKGIENLSWGVEASAGRARIGTTTPLTDITAHPAISTRFPALVEAANTVGSVQIRNRATLTGNICNASPTADTAPALLAYGGKRPGQRPRALPPRAGRRVHARPGAHRPPARRDRDRDRASVAVSRHRLPPGRVGLLDKGCIENRLLFKQAVCAMRGGDGRSQAQGAPECSR